MFARRATSHQNGNVTVFNTPAGFTFQSGIANFYFSGVATMVATGAVSPSVPQNGWYGILAEVSGFKSFTTQSGLNVAVSGDVMSVGMPVANTSQALVIANLVNLNNAATFTTPLEPADATLLFQRDNGATVNSGAFLSAPGFNETLTMGVTAEAPLNATATNAQSTAIAIFSDPADLSVTITT